MAEKDVLDQLAKLSNRQREILKKICAGNEYKTIAKELFIGETTIKAHVGNIYVKLGLDHLTRTMRHKAIHEVYCPALREMGDFKKEKEISVPEPEPKPIPKNVELMVIEDEIAIIPRVTGEVIEIKPREVPWENPPKRRRVNPINLIVILLVLVLAIFGGYKVIETFLGLKPPAEANPPSIVQQNIAAPTEIPIIPTNTQVIPTITPSPKPTATIPASGILFEDNFDKGLSPQWEILSGEPMISNGMLGASQETWLIVGDPSWKNYSVEYKADSFFNYLNTNYNVTAVRVFDTGNMYASEWSSSQIQWEVVSNGNWVDVPESNRKIGDSDVNTHKIVVKDNVITTFINGVQTYYFADSKYTQGRIAIMVYPGTLIDNFVVKVITE